MMRFLSAAASLMLLVSCSTVGAHGGEELQYRDLTAQFADFAGRTEGMPDEQRLVAFEAEIVPLWPDFYGAREGVSPERRQANILRWLNGFPEIEERYRAIEASFPEAYAAAQEHFREFFPGFEMRLPVVMLHSLGEMDGGTRTFNEQTYMAFGADVIARIHAPETIGPFMDHELFHTEHNAYLTDCNVMWCALWGEGLATAAAAKMNPGASTRALLLDIPRPIKPEVDAHWQEAICRMLAAFDSEDGDLYVNMFQGNGGDELLPPRWGYYIGYHVANRALETHTLADLAHMPTAQAGPLARKTLEQMAVEAGGCQG